MVMLFGFVLCSTSGTKDLDIIRLYEASKCSLRLYKAAMIKETVDWFCELRLRHATSYDVLTFSDVIWLSTNFKSCWQVLCLVISLGRQEMRHWHVSGIPMNSFASVVCSARLSCNESQDRNH